MSIPGPESTAARLVRAGFVVALVLANVSGFRPVLARYWHELVCAVWRSMGSRSLLYLLKHSLEWEVWID